MTISDPCKTSATAAAKCYVESPDPNEYAAFLFSEVQRLSVPAPTATRSIVTNGITLTFPADVKAAQYASGDWAVQVPCPAPVISGNVSGAMWSPACGQFQGLLEECVYSETLTLRYNPELNVLGKLPATIQNEGSLVLADPLPPPTLRVNLDSLAVVSFVSRLPAFNELRPPYTRASPAGLGLRPAAAYVPEDSQLIRLPNLAVEAPSAAELVRRLRGPWAPDFYPTYAGSALFPAKNMPNYGRDMAGDMYAGMAFLLCDRPLEEKRQVATHLVQFGLDSLGIKTSVGFDEKNHWLIGGAHACGRRGALAALQDLCKITALGTEHHNESHQTFIVDGECISKGTGYTQADLGLPEWAEQYARGTWTGTAGPNKDWFANAYRRVGAPTWWGYAAYAMAVNPALATPAFLEYMERFNDVQGGFVTSGAQEPYTLAYGSMAEFARNVWLEVMK